MTRRAVRRGLAVACGLPALAVTPVAAYIGLVTAAAWTAVARGRTRTALPPAPSHRFVVLVPAHDEERLIGATLDSLSKLDYPAELISVHVVADNCNDATATIVRGRGCEAHERVAPDAGGKGPALGWLVDRLRDRGEPFDAAVIVDADTIVSPNLLRVADAKLAAGARAVQAYYGVRDHASSTATAFRAAALAARHYLRPLGRAELGGTAGLFGNGMVLAADVLATRSFSEHLVEDIELSLEMLLDGERIAFAPDALVEAEMPTTLEASRTQHERWERGRLEMAKRFGGPLARRAVAGGPAGRVAYADAAMDQLVPPFSLVAAATAASVVAAGVGAVVAPGAASRRRLLVALAGAVVHSAYVLSALRLVRAPASVYRALLDAPRLVWWKVRLWLRTTTRADVAWVRTERNAERAATGPQVATRR